MLGLTVIATIRLVAGAAAGAVTADQLVTYALLRFGLELVRGDDRGGTLLGFAEAQWTSLAIALAVAAAETTGRLPWSEWALPAVGALGTAFLTIGLLRLRPRSRHRLLAPRHWHESARALADDAMAAVPPPASAVTVHTTSLGVCLSSCTLTDGGVRWQLYTMSPGDAATARTLADLIRRLAPHPGVRTLAERRPGLFQLVVTLEE